MGELSDRKSTSQLFSYATQGCSSGDFHLLRKDQLYFLNFMTVE